MENDIQSASKVSELLFRVNAFISSGGEDFNQLALALFAFQFESVPIYRQFCESRRIKPGLIQQWNEIPALPVSAFKEHIVSSIEEKQRSRVFHSSGTTGHVPSRHFHNAASLSIYEASLLPWFAQHVLTVYPDFLVFLAPPPPLAPHSSLLHMFETVQKKYGGANSFYGASVQADGSWNLEFDRIETTLRGAISGNRRVALLGTAFSFVHWLDFLAGAKRRFSLPAGSCIMETGGYKGRSRTVAKTELRRLMTKYLGVPDSHLVTEYGMSELSSQAYDGVVGEAAPPVRVFRFPPWARAQVISPETGRPASEGETGLLRVFDLANIRSVMAIQTEDLAVNRGDGFELLGRAAAAEPRGCSLLAAT